MPVTTTCHDDQSATITDDAELSGTERADLLRPRLAFDHGEVITAAVAALPAHADASGVPDGPIHTGTHAEK